MKHELDESAIEKQRAKSAELAKLLELDPEEIRENPYKVVRPAMDWQDERGILYKVIKHLTPKEAKVRDLLNEIAYIPEK